MTDPLAALVPDDAALVEPEPDDAALVEPEPDDAALVEPGDAALVEPGDAALVELPNPPCGEPAVAGCTPEPESLCPAEPWLTTTPRAAVSMADWDKRELHPTATSATPTSATVTTARWLLDRLDALTIVLPRSPDNPSA